MRTNWDQDFRKGSQQYLKKKAERREAQQRFFEDNLNEQDIYNAEVQRRKEAKDWVWSGHSPSNPFPENLQIENQNQLEGLLKQETIENKLENQEKNLEELLLGESNLKEVVQSLEGSELIEPEVILGKIETFLDVILRSIQINFKGKKKKKDRMKGDKRNSNSKRKKHKKREKKTDMKLENKKEEELLNQVTHSGKLGGGDILKLGELLKSSND